MGYRNIKKQKKLISFLQIEIFDFSMSRDNAYYQFYKNAPDIQEPGKYYFAGLNLDFRQKISWAFWEYSPRPLQSVYKKKKSTRKGENSIFAKMAENRLKWAENGLQRAENSIFGKEKSSQPFYMGSLLP